MHPMQQDWHSSAFTVTIKSILPMGARLEAWSMVNGAEDNRWTTEAFEFGIRNSEFGMRNVSVELWDKTLRTLAGNNQRYFQLNLPNDIVC